MKNNIIKLNNGITVLYKKIKNINGVVFDLIFKAGSYNDYIGKSGLAHFCEHILMGFPTKSATKMQRREEMKNYYFYNAYTSSQIVNFSTFVPKEEIDKALNLITDPFKNIIIKKEDIEDERKIIKDEILTLVKRNRQMAYYLKTKKLSLNKEIQNREYSPAGSIESVNRIQMKDINKFLGEFFNKENLVIVVAGNIRKREVLTLIKKYINPRILDKGKRGFDFNNLLGYKKSKKIIKIKPVEDGKAYLNIEYDFKVNRERYMTMERSILLNIFSSMINEQIFTFYRDKNNLCYSANGIFSDTNIYESVVLSIECQEENLKDIISKFKEFKNVILNYDEALFEKHKRKILGSFQIDLSSARVLAKNLYDFYDCFGEIPTERRKLKILKCIKNLKFENIKDKYIEFLNYPPIITIVSQNEININNNDFYEKKTQQKNVRN